MRVTAFTGAAEGRSEVYRDAVEAFGGHLAKAGVEVVYGGGRVGLMGVLADATLAAGGTVIGVIPQSLVDAEVAHTGLTELIVVETMHERKATMARLGDAFVALPGGTGTLDELFEAWTWQQLGLHDKPVALLNPAGFWDPLLAALEHMRAAGFVRPAARLPVAGDADEFLRLVWPTPAGDATGR
ncbi:LOG family protein [Rugosimonospora africana]|uniref:Cytokinin riboside 5'-monophosphate phosphoribohydrolase n=1 Tax=Rugosimonospora africana TaxID=556532 RepID=A0A8J3VQR2_9ACTN|nr:TIGR00730 family Rossman fold protein [Rugosimonospora africana]GIH15400.1 putative cytokinin riboside 5'-monophosphate phosphoribohydrolase [Rugosimonospora africana]